MKTVIVGGVAAGASTGARLRRLDESAEIVILERDHYVSFANCGLPYHIGGAIPDRDSLLLQTTESLGKSLALDVRTGQDVIRIDRDAKEVEVRDLAQGRTYREPYDKLVLCSTCPPCPTMASSPRRSQDDMIAGARVEVAPYKKHPADFVLWKPSDARAAGLAQPLGPRPPGLAYRMLGHGGSHLGVTFDIHGGGIDLIFPHHENEIAQSRCAHDGAPLGARLDA